MVHLWWMESETVVIAFPLAPAAGAGAWNRRLCHHHRSFIRTRRDGNDGDVDGDGNEGGLTPIRLSTSEEEQPFAIPPPISAPVKELEAPEASAAPSLPSSPQLASTDITTASTDTTGTTTGTTASGFRQEAPKYNGEAKALDVFSNEWFYIFPSDVTEYQKARETKLGNSTVAAITDACIKYPKKFADSIGTIEEPIRDYFLTGDLDLKKILLPKLIQTMEEASRCASFQSHKFMSRLSR